MKRRTKVHHEFVEFIPSNRKDGVVYVSIPYATAVHNCCCGCGNKVVTPLSPTDWKVTFDGDTISLYPSIGNWNFECQSHYWIIDDKVKWARGWSKEEIQSGKEKDASQKKGYFGRTNRTASQTV